MRSVVVVACGFALCPILLCQAFSIRTQITSSRRRFSPLYGSLDYEYVPSGSKDNLVYSTNLPSSYPSGTPAGLRGEAIRSAIRSNRCVAWNLNGTPLEYGVLQVNGPGALPFLNNKLTQSFPSKSDYFKDACLLTAKGRIVDRLGVAVTDAETAYVVTSPGHTSTALFRRLDPFIFPMDQVSLVDCGDASIFSIASLNRENVQRCFDSYMLPQLGLSSFQLPQPGECLQIALNDDQSAAKLVVLPRSDLPPCAGIGFTFMLLFDAKRRWGDQVWRYLVSDACPNGPIEAGALEFETLRIQSGQVAFGQEMTGRDEKNADITTPASPLELFLSTSTYIDADKGCYLGQEGVASIVKNPRGPPRTLYQVVFDDDFNLYDYQSHDDSDNDGGDHDNLTRLPVVGDKLYALGSNEEVFLGYLTSVAEPGSTGEAETLALALIRRPDTILKQLKERDIEIPSKIVRPLDAELDGSSSTSLLIQPPPLDPLDGLEVIVGGTFTIGSLAMVAGRRRKNLFDDDVPEFVKNLPKEDSMQDLIPLTKLNDASRTTIDAAAVTEVVDDEAAEDALREEELAKAIADADEAAAEAKRKAEKMEMLRKRAEEAMERRKQRGAQ